MTLYECLNLLGDDLDKVLKTKQVVLSYRYRDVLSRNWADTRAEFVLHSLQKGYGVICSRIFSDGMLDQTTLFSMNTVNRLKVTGAVFTRKAYQQKGPSLKPTLKILADMTR